MRKPLAHGPNLGIVNQDRSALGCFAYWDITEKSSIRKVVLAGRGGKQ